MAASNHLDDPEPSFEIDPALFCEIHQPQLTPFELVYAKERDRLIMQALASDGDFFTDDERLVLVAHHILGIPLHAIAARLRKSNDATGRALARAMRRFAARLERMVLVSAPR